MIYTQFIVDDYEELKAIAETRDELTTAVDHKYRVYEESSFIDVYGGSKPLSPRIVLGLLERHQVVPVQVMNHTHLGRRVEFEGVDYEDGVGNKKFGYRMWFAHIIPLLGIEE